MTAESLFPVPPSQNYFFPSILSPAWRTFYHGSVRWTVLHLSFRTSSTLSLTTKISGVTLEAFNPTMRCGSSSTLMQCVFPPTHKPRILRQTQAVCDLDSNAPVYRRCLRALRWMCSTFGMLPKSYMVSAPFHRADDRQPALGGFSDVWKCSDSDGQIFAVKALRVSNECHREVKKARYWRRHYQPPDLHC